MTTIDFNSLCDFCEGRGWTECVSGNQSEPGEEPESWKEECSICNGTGKMDTPEMAALKEVLHKMRALRGDLCPIWDILKNNNEDALLNKLSDKISMPLWRVADSLEDLIKDLSTPKGEQHEIPRTKPKHI